MSIYNWKYPSVAKSHAGFSLHMVHTYCKEHGKKKIITVWSSLIFLCINNLKTFHSAKYYEIECKSSNNMSVNAPIMQRCVKLLVPDPDFDMLSSWQIYGFKI